MIEYMMEALERFVGLYREKKKENRQLTDDALRAVQFALNETEIYYARLDRGSLRNEETELQLSRYWSAASIPFRHVDTGFADVCEHKSRYWLNPENWDEKKVARYKIRLSNVARRVRVIRGDLGSSALVNKKPRRQSHRPRVAVAQHKD